MPPTRPALLPNTTVCPMDTRYLRPTVLARRRQLSLPRLNSARVPSLRCELYGINNRAFHQANISRTFPTGLVQQPVDYTWAGTLPTIGPMGQSVCSTGSAVIPYPSGTFTATSVGTSTSADDPGGLLWTLVTDGCVVAPDPSRVPNDAAPKLCSIFGVCPANVKTTASFLTETSTSHIDSAPATSPVPAQPAKSPTGNSNPGSAIVSAAVGAASKAASSGSGSGGNTGANSGGSNSGGSSGSESSGSGNSNSGSSQGQGASNNNGQSSNNNGAAPAASPQGQAQPTPAPVVVGGSTYSASVAGGSTVYNVGGQTLAAGSTIVVGSGPSATTIALQASAGNTQVVVNGKTSTLTGAAATLAPVVIGGSTVTPSVAAGGSTVLNVGGSTVALGSTITLGSGSSATTIAYQISGGQTQVVVNGQTSTLPSTTTAGGVGNAVMSGLGGIGGSGSATTAPVMFTGGAERTRVGPALGVLAQAVYLLLFWR